MTAQNDDATTMPRSTSADEAAAMLPLVALAGAALGAARSGGYDRAPRPAAPIGARSSASCATMCSPIPRSSPRRCSGCRTARSASAVAAQPRRDRRRRSAAPGPAIRRATSPWSSISTIIAAIAAPACRRSQQLIARDPKLRVVYPRAADPAPRPAAPPRAPASPPPQQGKFAARFHDALYAAGPVSDATIAAAARSAGVDLPAPPCPPTPTRRSRATWRPPATLGLTGTPELGDRRPRPLRRAAARGAARTRSRRRGGESPRLSAARRDA